MAYPSTPKLERHPQKYTYKDLMADRERLEQKIKYIKNLLNVNESTTDDTVRVRRSDSDRTANKIAKMFLTLSAVNGLHDRRKPKCKNEDDVDDRVEDVWEKERRSNPFRKSTSSNEERYKVKKWIEFMKNKRSSGKTCPCLRNAYVEESEVFPLEQKLPKGHFLLERGRSSEESSELYGDPYYYSRDKINKNDNVKKRLSKSQDQDAKSKALSNNGKRKLELPFEDLELYRSRARQILQNAEEILDKIKEEEEKRLAAPNVLMNRLKELTSRIHGDPRNNENDLIRKIQKNLGWGPLAKPQDNTDGTFLDNVKSFILDPYEKAKALTDESTKKLSSYLLRNLGRLQESSEEEEMKNADETLKIYFGDVPHKEEKPSSANLAKEGSQTDELSKDKDLENWEDTLSPVGGSNDAINKESNWDANQEPPQQKMESLIKENQKKLNDYNIGQSGKETDTVDDKESAGTLHSGKETVGESEPESDLEEERVAMKLNGTEMDENNQDVTTLQSTNKKDEKGIKNAEAAAVLEKTAKDSDTVKNNKFRGMEGTLQGKNGENNDTASRDMQEEEEFEKEIEEIVESITDKENSEADEELVQNPKAQESEKKAANEDIVAEVVEKQEENEKENEKVSLAEIAVASSEAEKITSKEGRPGGSITDDTVGKKDVLSPTIFLINEASPNDYPLTETEENSKEIVKADIEQDEFESPQVPVLEKQRKLGRKQSEEEMKVEENKLTLENFREDTDPETEKESSLTSAEILKESKKDSLNYDISQNETSAKTLPKYADLVQEVKQSSKEFSEANPIESKLESFETQEEESSMGEEKPLTLDDEEKQGEQHIRKENADGETLKAMLDNEDKEEGKIENSLSEDLTEDLNKPLKATVENRENSNDSESDLKISSKESDVLLKETNYENEKNETPEDINDETMKEIFENKSRDILGEEKNDQTSFSAEKLTEDMDNQSRAKSLESDNDETLLRESKPNEEVLENVKKDETLLRAVMSSQDQDGEDADETQEYNSSQLIEKDGNLDKEGSNEPNLKARLDKYEDLEKDYEITVEAKSSKHDERPEENENLNEDQEIIFNSENSSEDVEGNIFNQENNDEGGSRDTLGVLHIQENLDKTDEATTSKEIQNSANTSEKDDTETVVNPDEKLNIEDKDTSQELLKALSNQEIQSPKQKDSEENLREANFKENVQDEKSEKSEEKNNSEPLKAIQDKLKLESMQIDEYELDQGDLHSDTSGEDENLEAVLENETQESLEKRPDDETDVKIAKATAESERSQGESNLEASSENHDDDEDMNDDITLKQANMEESEDKQDNLKDNNDVGAVFENHEQTGESRQNLGEDKIKKNKDVNDEKILLMAENFEGDINNPNNQNSNDETHRAVSSEQNQENLKKNYENLQAESFENEEKMGDYETPLKSASLEDEFDNKIQYETLLKSAQSEDEIDDLESMKSVNEVGGEETPRSENAPYDLNYETDDENEDEAVLKSMQFNAAFPDDFKESSQEMIRGENLETGFQLKATNPEENLQEHSQFHFLGNPQKADSASKSLKATSLKVPDSIRKIIKDLDGKEKNDITSIQNLNPDKIDHVLDKIDEAEQQNLLESEEMDCRKECACAEEMNTRFRNIGRYEIVKDFLQWVKDLQLNRVLSDD